jgi:hypothetical protein
LYLRLKKHSDEKKAYDAENKVENAYSKKSKRLFVVYKSEHRARNEDEEHSDYDERR